MASRPSCDCDEEAMIYGDHFKAGHADTSSALPGACKQAFGVLGDAAGFRNLCCDDSLLMVVGALYGVLVHASKYKKFTELAGVQNKGFGRAHLTYPYTFQRLSLE
jgi:hypothetical protein